MTRKAVLAILMVLLGCCSNVVFLEFLARNDPGCGNLITFSSFLLISIEGFIFTTKFGTVQPKVPFSAWAYLVILYFVVSVTNNYALSFHISMPLHMIFRAGSLMANMILGMILLGKRYTPAKYLSVLMISVGIATCTIMSAQDVKKGGGGDLAEELEEAEAADVADAAADADKDAVSLFTWLIGIGVLTLALFLSARMGIYQEVIYGKYGKHPKEALFYTHCLPLPGFLLFWPNIHRHFLIVLNSAPLTLVPGLLEAPSMLVYLVCNVLTQYLCISAVFVLTTECASLTVTLVVTLRKFISLLFSIWYFSHPFTLAHWLGTALVFSGTLLFSDVPAMIRGQQQQQRQLADKKQE